MNKQEIAKGLSPFVMMAFVDSQNIETGFLTRHRINKMTKEQIMGFSMETENIINDLSHQLEQVADGNIPTDFECGTLFQYVFSSSSDWSRFSVNPRGYTGDPWFLLRGSHARLIPSCP